MVLRSNKISLNTSQTEILFFRPKAKTITKHLNFRISGERIKTILTTVKYLDILLLENLNWPPHIDAFVTKLSRAAGLLSKVRYYIPKYLLTTILNLQLSYDIYLSSMGSERVQNKENLRITR